MAKKIPRYFPEDDIMIAKLNAKIEKLAGDEVEKFQTQVKYAIQALVIVQAKTSAEQLVEALKLSKFSEIVENMDGFQKEVDVILASTDTVKNLGFGDEFDRNISYPVAYLNRIGLVGEDWYFHRKGGMKGARGHFGRNVGKKR